MKDENKTKKQLITELKDMHRSVAELEALKTGDKQADDIQRDSEDPFRAIFDNVRDGIALLDMTGRVIKINKRIIEVGGHTEEELIGKRIKLLKMFTPSSIVKMLSAFAKTISSQHVEPYEVEFYTKQGKKINAEVHGSPFRKRGKVVGAVAVMRDVSERKQAAETLKQSEERLRQIADNVPDLIWAKDMDDRFIFVNQAMCDKVIMCGTQDKAIGKTDMFFAEREKKAGYKHSFGEICVNSDAITKERKAPERFLEDGFVRDKYLVLDVHKAPFLDKDGEMIGTVGCGRDVTKEKITEDALKESEEKYRILSEQSTDAIYITARKGKFSYINQSFLDLFGYTKKEMKDLKAQDTYVNPEDRSRFQQKIEKTGSVRDFEVKLRKKDGTEIDCLITANARQADDGSILGYQGIIRDITERKRVEEALRESEEKHRALFKKAQDAIFLSDETGRFVDVNRAACELLDYSRKELLNLSIKDIDADPRGYKAFLKVRDGLTKTITFEVNQRRKDGALLPVEVTGSFFTSGSQRTFLAIVRDITERKKMEDELLKSKKLESIGVLAGGIAHDYNNLLTAIIGNISLAQSYLKPDGEAFKLLSEAQKASMGAKDLTQKLITFSKGGTPIKKAAPISPLLKNTTELALSGSNIKCEWFIADDLWPIEIDEAQIGQVIHSLVINAREAMSEGGSIYVSAENISIDQEKDLLLNKGKFVKISIKDQGSGIPDKYLGKIFDPYFSTKQRSTQKGMGLGLSICHSIIKKHDGYITAESAPDAGTTFHVYLPASQTQVIEEEAPITERPMASRGSILVMDDEELVRNVAGQMLTRLGYDVAFAKDGSEAIEMYKKAMESEKSFDAVILDLTVKGGMGGKETVKKLLEIDSDVKAILSSGYSDDPAMTDFRKHAFCSTIVKPYDIDEMDRVIFEAIK